MQTWQMANMVTDIKNTDGAGRGGARLDIAKQYALWPQDGVLVSVLVDIKLWWYSIPSYDEHRRQQRVYTAYRA